MNARLIKKQNEQLLYDEETAAQERMTTMPAKSMLTMIAAAAENNALGKDNDLIWHISDDLKRFKRLTSGHAIIMGRKTFESMPKALPNRTNIVLTKKKNYHPQGAVVVHSVEKAMELVKQDPQPFVIGGGEIYRLFLDRCDRIELTRVHQEFDADVFFPDIPLVHWKETFREKIPASKEQPLAYSFITYDKIKT